MPIKASKIPEKSIIKEYISYDRNTGIFKWKKSIGGARIGDIAGTAHKKGYTSITIMKKSYLAHRLAWTIEYGNIGEFEQIDHINGNRSDNRIKNLRIASHGENCINSKTRSHNFSGIKGVHFDKRRNKYRARIVKNKKSFWLGHFNTPEEAHAAYCEAAIKLHGSFAKT